MIDHALDRAAEAIATAEAFLIGAGPAWGSTAVCPTSAASKGSGGPIRRMSGSGSTSSRWPTRAGLPRIPRWRGASTGTGWGFIGGPLRTRGSRFSPLGSRMNGGFVFTSNVDGHFQRPALTRNGSSKFTAASRNAMHERVRHRDLFRRVDRGRDRPGDDAGDSSAAVVPPLWRPGRPNIFMFGDCGLGLRPDR